jgi:hypothetical protein
MNPQPACGYESNGRVQGIGREEHSGDATNAASGTR